MKTFSASNKQGLLQEAYAFALTHGLLVSTGEPYQMTHCPFTLYPTAIPRNAFSAAVTLGPCFNNLVDKMARDIPFLKDTLADVCAVDEFMGGLMKITLDVYDGKNKTQPWMLGIYRSDYMIEKDTNRLLQVEINTISVAFTALSTQVNRLHEYTLSKIDKSAMRNVKISQSSVEVPKALKEACHIWRQQQYPLDNGCTKGVIVFVVQPNERNVCDQRILEQTLWIEYGIQCVRASLEEVAKTFVLNAESGHLETPDGLQAAVAYFRCGYTPSDYYNADCWKGREMIERGTCIKGPSLPYHLCTAKKIQERMADEYVLNNYVRENEVRVLLDCMVKQYDLKKDEALVAPVLQDAIKNPHGYVLKPQREGGGNLVHSDTMVEMFKRGLTPEERAEYILMERINSVECQNTIIRNGAVYAEGKTIPELGIFSVFLGDGTTQVVNSSVGHLLRTKMATVEDGGVMSGVSALDSPYVE